jgi:hypothetical protein
MKPNHHVADSKECIDCRTVLRAGAPVCGACGGMDFRDRPASRFPYDAIAAFIGVIVVILFWVVRG